MAANIVNILEFRCARLLDHLGPNTKVHRLSGWAADIEVFTASDILYIPEYSMQARGDIVPLEAILYDSHLPWIQRDVKPERATIDLDQVERSAEEVCILGNLASRAFGHWTEELLKVLILEHFGFTGKYVITQAHRQWAHDSLAVMGVSGARILAPAKPVVYSTAYYTTMISHSTAMQHQKVFFKLREDLHAAAASEAGLGERIWLDRGKTAVNGRYVINSEEVHAAISKFGFTPIDIGSFPFRKQIAIARDMDVLCGPHGSAFVHCQFMHDRKDVIQIFSPLFVNPDFIQLCQIRQHRYNQIVPTHAQEGWPYEHGRDLLIDIDHLDLVLSSLRPWPLSWGPVAVS